MRARWYTIVSLILLGLIGGPAYSQEPGRSSGGPSIFDLIPADSSTEHLLKTPNGDIRYTATAGTIDLFGQTGTRNAKIFYTAYKVPDAESSRPVTFVFNGGPGAASAYLHLGLMGPKVASLGSDSQDGTTPTLEDNPSSWIGFTDLVFIDPVGTGWSRAVPDAQNAFYGVRQDAESLAKFIALYTQKNNRLSSPKYLVGESYGGFRSAKVAKALKDSQGILVSGIVMVSPMIDGRFLMTADTDPVTAALQLPSLAAAEFERTGTFLPQKVQEAEAYAMSTYLVSLAGATPSGAEAEALYAHVAALTGVPKDAVARTRGFVSSVYRTQSAGNGRLVSPYDGADISADAYPERANVTNDDSILDGYTRAYGALFAAYARNDLRFETDMTYTLLSGEVNRQWDWDGRRSDANASDDIRDLLSVIPSFRLAVLHGYSDILTPYGVSKFLLNHLPEQLATGRTELKLYRGGHMFYSDPNSRRQANEDMRSFYRAAISGQAERPRG
ncbi:S10 family peptidase [Aliirhizobium smilacinae]|uniref:Carboxypeptidase n=1 Tax=Aliirhizobium smilacinae TaxID=1395944 RepID=A0A5C4XHI1_9HYPH|nr:carboxypeptidase [Rhizobium smilacinae]TNM62867.1 carboxypeptidase [Rhizobium smilacinae]